MALLNPENSIIVGGYKFFYDFENETVNVEDLRSYSLKTASKEEYSWDEDVVDIVFFDGSRASLKGTLAKACKSRKKQQIEYYSQNTTVTMKVDYNKIPMANNLKAKVTKTLFRPGIHLYVACGDDNMPTGYESDYQYKNNNDCHDCESDSDDGYGSSIHVDLYGPASKRLFAYRGYGEFIITDEYNQPSDIDIYYLVHTCSAGSLTCD